MPCNMEGHMLIKDKVAHAITYLPRYEDVWMPGDAASRIINLANGRRGVVRCMPQPQIGDLGA